MEEKSMNIDLVNAPPHYKSKGVVSLGVEVIDVLMAVYKDNYALGNAVKYLLRAPYKGTMNEDLKKCVWYINYYLSQQEGKKDEEQRV